MTIYLKTLLGGIGSITKNERNNLESIIQIMLGELGQEVKHSEKPLNERLNDIRIGIESAREQLARIVSVSKKGAGDDTY